MDALQTLLTLLPLALTSGINLYATVLVVGMSIRFCWVERTPAGLDVLAAWPVLITAALLYLVEFLADKIPFIDNVWDTISTFVRPLGAALIAMAALGDLDPALKVSGTLIAAGVALATHGGKAGGRAVLNLASPAENVSNVFVSLMEDVLVGALAYLALRYPYAAAAIAGLIMALILLVLPRLIRWAWYTLRAVAARLTGMVRKIEHPEAMPAAHLALFAHRRPHISAQAKAQNLRGVGGRSGYLSYRDGFLTFTYDTWRGLKAWQLPERRLQAAYLRHRPLVDILEIHYTDEKGRERLTRFATLKDRARLAQQFHHLLAEKTAPPVGTQ